MVRGDPLREHPVGTDDERTRELLAEAWLEREPDEQSRRLLRRLSSPGLDVDLRLRRSPRPQPSAQARRVVLNEDALPWDVRQGCGGGARSPHGAKRPRDDDRVRGTRAASSVSVKLQELFGLAETPRFGPSQVPITFEMLAPNGRPVQTTQDLKSFWERTYPEVRKELRGRYPRHPWPEDPWTATATHRPQGRGASGR